MGKCSGWNCHDSSSSAVADDTVIAQQPQQQHPAVLAVLVVVVVVVVVVQIGVQLIGVLYSTRMRGNRCVFVDDVVLIIG